MKHHAEDPDGGLDAIERGSANLARHIGIVREFGLAPVVAVNRRPEDTDEEVELALRLAQEHGTFAAAVNDAFARGGEGAVELAEAVVAATEQPSSYAPVYSFEQPIAEKIEAIATRVYGAASVEFLPAAREKLGRYADAGLGKTPICMAKTHLSLTADPNVMGAPSGFTIPVRDLRPYTGAGWLVALCGDMQTMPGLGVTPALQNVDIDESGRTVGLF
jgi:formate--tetrahydrofolate ligase